MISARRLACVRFETLSFRKTFDRWNLTVCSVTSSVRPTSAFDSPFATRRTISVSRSVSSFPGS